MTARESKLLQPYEGPALQTPHRIAMAPMTRNRAGQSRVPNDLMATYYAQRTSAALMVTEAVDVAPQAVGYPGTPGWYTDEMRAGWGVLVQRVRAAQPSPRPLFSQLFHTGRVSHTSLQPDGAPPLAPSAIAADVQLYTAQGMQPASTPHALTVAEIGEIVEQYVAAGRAAIAAGFDGVEINAGNGYLVDQFLKDGTNRRDDGYGGSISGRTRFLLEIVDALAAAIGSRKVAVRVSPVHTTNGISESDPKALFTALAESLDARDLAYVHAIEPAADPAVTRAMRPLLRGTLVVNDGYDRALAEAAVDSGLADLVSFARPFLANPDLPTRIARDAPLNEPDPASFYGGTDEGYTSYPTLEE